MKKYLGIPGLIVIGMFIWLQSGAIRPEPPKSTISFRSAIVQQDTVPRKDTSWHHKKMKSKMKKDTSNWPKDTVPH